MPSDADRLDWLESRGLDAICFTDGSALDIVNSPMGLRAEIDAQIEQEERNAQQVG